jgi:hypothetical protein
MMLQKVLMLVGAAVIVVYVATHPAILQDAIKLLQDIISGLGGFFKSL